jgi:hypothetical protein
MAFEASVFCGGIPVVLALSERKGARNCGGNADLA